MKLPGIAFLCALTLAATAQKRQSVFASDDIPRFWQAYDRIIATKDSAQQYRLLHELFLDKGTAGLKAIMQARSYTDRSYIDAIKAYPLFWNSIRQNTLKAGMLAEQIAVAVDRLGKIYPDLRPAGIYFTIGALRTGGTALNGMVLIGSEISLADSTVITTEFPASLAHLVPFFKSNPVNNIVFTNVHEYIHTQQKTTTADRLLQQSVLEGVAEFGAALATGKASLTPALGYGSAHEQQVKARFAEYMFNPFNGYWLYSNAANEFGNTRDLGYYVGYAICEKFYQRAADKQGAFKEMIELDYADLPAVKRFVDRSGYFNTAADQLETQFQQSRPTVTGMEGIVNGVANAPSGSTIVTLHFSEPMDKRFRSFGYGPLGEPAILRVKRFIAFSEDGRSASFEVSPEAGKHYQLNITESFRSENGIALKPFLIDFTTGGN